MIVPYQNMMKEWHRKILQILFSFVIAVISGFTGYAQSTGKDGFQLTVNDARPGQTVADTVFCGSPEKRYVMLKDNAEEKTALTAESTPDVEFRIKVPNPGVYEIRTEVQRLNIEKGKKVATLRIKLQIDNQRATQRIVSDAYNYTDHLLGRFRLSGSEQELRIWLPHHIALYAVKIKKYMPVAVPPQAADYKPRIVPPETRPRLWVNRESLPLVQKRLTKGENRRVWAEFMKEAQKQFDFEFDPKKEISRCISLEQAVQAKAFCYLMTGDHILGLEAVKLMLDYLSVLEYGNNKSGDITREIGSSIYTAALTYDWCYSLMDSVSKTKMYSGMMHLAEDMEIGWPPFKESVVNGHASEAQVNRDLLSMGIAVYDDDPEPYRYASYLILEELAPMRAFEYQSPRHNQGIDYGAYRHGWEMHAAWLFYRMSGVRVFDENITSLPKYWFYMQLPGKQMLRDGDVFTKEGYYWKNPEPMLLDYSYANDPLIKAEFEKRNKGNECPLLFLLLNDPGLKAETKKDSLPLTIDFGNILGGLIARTGWNMDENSNDVVAEIKGGGYHFGNHQHADAGAMQIYYRGHQVCDLGRYYSYGTPYDFNFNKRSVAHSMILVKDPDEQQPDGFVVNDGGARFNRRTPGTPQEVMSDPWFDNGEVISADFGPSQQKPLYSYFQADLTDAYPGQVSKYVREFCFLNMKREDIPAVILLSDNICTSQEDMQTFWKINTVVQPSLSGTNIILQNHENGGKTYINMLLPSQEKRKIEISDVRDTDNILNYPFHIPPGIAESNEYQIIAFDSAKTSHHRFLTVFQMVSGNTKPFAVKFKEENGIYFLSVADRIVGMNANSGLIQKAFSVEIGEDRVYQVLLTDLKPGSWEVRKADGRIVSIVDVKPRKNTILFTAGKGKYFISQADDKFGRDFELLLDNPVVPANVGSK
jgi:heparin/heparan-sulfate lyase